MGREPVARLLQVGNADASAHRTPGLCLDRMS